MPAESKAQQALAGASKTARGRAQLRAKGKRPMSPSAASKYAKAPGGTTKGLPARKAGKARPRGKGKR